MAVQLPGGLYSGFTEVLDSSPTANRFFILQQKREAEKKAKDEALNQYFHDVTKQLNPAGIRSVHLGGVQGQQPGIIDKINEWGGWSIKNKSEIAKGGTARMISDMMVQNILIDIQKAKDADKFLLEVGKAKFEGKYDPDDDDINVLDKASKSIYDQQHYKEDGVSPYSWGDLSTNVPDYDINKAFEAGAKGMKGGKTYDEGKGRRDPQTGLEWIPYTEKFSDAQIPQIAKNVASEYNTNKSAKKYWDTQFKKLSEDDYKKLNATYKQYFPQETIKLPNGQVLDMSNIDTAEELAIASSALRAKEFVAEQGEVPKSDYERRLEDKRINIRINSSPGKQSEQIDLREYPDVDGGGKDITSLMQDINVVSPVTGSSFSATNVTYFPSTKKVKFTDPISGKEETLSLTTFLQNIRPQNPLADVKWLKEGLNNPIMGGTSKTNDAGKGVGGAAKKDKTEYTQITETNKGKIGVKNGKWYYVDTGKPAQ